MAETPEERLARLRREVESSWSPPAEPGAPGSADLELTTPPPASASAPGAAPGPAADGDPTVESTATPVVDPAPAPTPAPALDPAPMAGWASSAPQPARAVAPAPSRGSNLGVEGDGWSVADALGGASLGQWVAIGLVVVGGYLLLASFIPGIALPGSIAMTALGVILLWRHFGHGLGAWALYAGAILAAIGALRVVGDLLPFNVDGETSLGLGLALVGIGWLRHTQAGGWGWQGVVGVAALAWGAVQLVLGLLPGTPGLLDLVLPALLLGGGIWLLVRTSRDSHKNG